MIIEKMKRSRRQMQCHIEETSEYRTNYVPPCRLLLALILLQQGSYCDALISSSSQRAAGSSRSSGWGTIYSPLFCGAARRVELERRKQFREQFTLSSPSTTSLNMVLTTPESIIEQASTVNLLDDLIDESVRTSPRRPIMMQFDPSSGWIWRRWKGTIFSETWTSCVRNMVYASIIFVLYKKFPVIKEYLNGFGTLWGQLLSVTTFTLTFFVNQSYALWRKCYELSRRLQGRLHDIGMNLATHAARKVPTSPHETSTYTAPSRQILELMSRYIRLFDLLTYASFTRSHRPILTPRGMRRLVERGLMTPQEREVLVDAAIPATQRHSAILMWMVRLFVEGRASGHILGGDGFEQQTMEKFHVIRAQYGAIGDELQGRMPLAYAHVVQILVDLILWMYPVMAFSIGMSPIVAIAGTGLLTFSYQGLFDLAKQFLDPYDNENYGKGEDPLSVDTLIAETNAGSVRWMYGFEEMPFSQQKLKDGELYDYLLPVRGYSLDELAQMEDEKIQRETEMEKQRIREEQERHQREEQEAKAGNLQSDAIVDIGQPSLRDEVVTAAAAEVDKDETNREIAELQEVISLVEERHVHKITTLADGTVVSFKEEPEIVRKAPEITPIEIKPTAPDPAVPKGVAAYLASLSKEENFFMPSTTKEKDVEINGAKIEIKEAKILAADRFEYDGHLELPFFDEVSTVGQDMPVTPLLVDNEVKGADEVVAVTLTRDEYEKKIEEAKESARIELLQAMKIDGTPPVYFVTQELKNRATAGATRDKKVASRLAEQAVNMPDPVDEMLQQAQGLEDGDKVSIESERPETNMIGGTLKGTEVNNEFPFTAAIDDAMPAKPITSDKSLEGTSSEQTSQKSTSKFKNDAGANGDATSPVRLTLEDYNKQVEKIMEAAKEELLETEAILKARPGADPLGWDYDDEQLAPSSDGSGEEEEESVQEPEDEEMWSLLGMDGDTEVIDSENINNEPSNGNDISDDNCAKVDPSSAGDDNKETPSYTNDLVEAETAEEQFSEMVVDDSYPLGISTTPEDGVEATSEAKASDLIEAIFIDEEVTEDPKLEE